MQIQESDKTNSNEVESPTNNKELIEIRLEQRFSLKISLVAIFAALAIGGGYSLFYIPNVELMSVFIFISGLIYGKYIGSFVGLISSLIFYGYNPYGFDPIVNTTCILGMALFGLVGGFFNSNNFHDRKIEYSRKNMIKLATIGFFLTLIFDIITNIAFAFSFKFDLGVVFLTGIPFMIVHLVCNTIVYATVIIAVYNRVVSLSY